MKIEKLSEILKDLEQGRISADSAEAAIVKEITEGLEQMSNDYEIASAGDYVIHKTTLDHFIEKLKN